MYYSEVTICASFTRKKEAVLVKSTRLSFFADYGITTPLVGRLAVITGTFVVVLTAIGSFSIDGGSRGGTKTIIAKRVVLHASRPEEVVDYSKHVSVDGRRVSGTYLLTRDAALCGRQNSTFRSLSSMMANPDKLNLTSVEYYAETLTTNVSCLVKAEGFRNRLLLLESIVPDAPDMCFAVVSQ